ncbi:MAG: hypothetical protein EA378_02345 [Phycisphaerales bacterium]|nr:MAG: hypothetical protein EA378_02345 [Phycisphaerales bacterium]
MQTPFRHAAATITLGVLALVPPALTHTAIAQPERAGAAAHVQGEQGEPGEIASVDDLLRALESAGGDISNLTARVQYTRTFAIAGDTQTRQGQLFYEKATLISSAGPRPVIEMKRFAVRFETLILQGGRVEEEIKDYVFDGEWFVERTPGSRQFIKRQVVPPGEVFDPLKVGEGPFPLPIGQKRDDILAEYEASMVDPAEDLNESLAGFVTREAGTYRLRLIPRDPGASAREVEVWYRTDTLLPRLARTVSAEGDESFVQLVDVRQNEAAEIEPGIFNIQTPRPGSGWDVRVEPWRGEGGR